MEMAMEKVIEHVFNNWTALQLAVEHSMAGPNSKDAAISMLDYLVPFCINEAKNVNDIIEALEDLMDQEFDTICEDGSIEEIAAVLYKFVEILKAGNLELYNAEFDKLPVAQDWLMKSQAQIQKAPHVKPSTTNQPAASSSKAIEPMEEEEQEENLEWTEVKSRRKR